MAEQSFIERLRGNPLFRSFLLYSAFRAVYGFGILLFAYFFATSTEAPWWATVLIFIGSMIFSRILFKFIKSKRGLSETPSE